MKRIFPLIVAFTLVLACAAPAQAVDADDNLNDTYWVNLLDFHQCFPNGNWSYFTSGQKSIVVNIPTPRYMTIQYVDMVVGLQYAGIDFSVVTPWGECQLTKTLINGSLYRVYGPILNWGVNALPITVKNNSGYDIPWFEFYQVNVSSRMLGSSFTPLSGYVLTHGSSYQIVKDPSVSTPAYVDIPKATSTAYSYFNANFSIHDWRKFDFASFELFIATQSITSVSAYFGDDPIPVDVTYINSTSWPADYHMYITVDLRGFDRTASGSPTVRVDGTLSLEASNYIEIYDSVGYVTVNDINPDFYYFKSVKDAIDKQTEALLDALGASSPGAAGVDDKVTEQAGKLDSMGSAMESVSKPDVGSIEMSADSLVDPASLAAFSGALGFLFNSSGTVTMLLIVVLLATVAYIAYGKR